jgi:protein-tyrosine phosphatase
MIIYFLNFRISSKWGMSRSVSLVLAYLMTITCLSFEEALDSIKGARRYIAINTSFQCQLKDFEACHLQEVVIISKSI